MKNIIITILMLAMLFSLAACGGENPARDNGTTTTPEETTTTPEAVNTSGPEPVIHTTTTPERTTQTTITTELEIDDDPEPPDEAPPAAVIDVFTHVRTDLDPNKPMIALTFDDGPTSSTLRIIDKLEEYNSRATFFAIGNLAESRPEVIKRASDGGHEVMGHSWEHDDLSVLSPEKIKADLLKTADMIESITGIRPLMYRPPYGAVSEDLINVSRELGFSLILWSLDTKDWQSRNADTIYSTVMSYAEDRDIILMHDLYGTTADAAERVIPALIEQGYQLVTVSELFYYNSRVVEAGGKYSMG